MTHLKNLSRLTRAAMMLLVMLLTATTGWADAPSHKIVVIADPHVMGNGLQDGGTAWQNYLAGSRKLIDYSQALFDQAVSVIQTQKPELVLIVGDLTKDGEQASHDYVKDKLDELKTEGIQTLVIPGNHDLGTSDAKVYGETTTDATTIEDAAAFATLYADYGYGASSERLENTLTYACEPIEGLVVIGIDSGTEGTLSSTTLNWVCDKALAARAAGKQVIAMMHHPLIPHITGGETFVSNVSVSDYANVRNCLADAGITTIFTGHFHTSDIAKDWNADKTETIYDITTGSLCSYPCDYRVVTLNNAMTEMSIATETATGDATITITEAKDRLTTVMTNLAKEKIQTKLVNEGKNATLAAYAANMMGPKMASAYIYHAEGDENSNDDAQELLNTLNATFSSYPAYQALVNSMLQDKSNYGDADREDQTNDRTLTGISMPLVVSTWAQLKAACEAGGTVTLTNHVTRDAAERILIKNTTVTVDLNGYTILGYADGSTTHYDSYSIFNVVDGGCLTITDGSSTKSGTIANVWGADAIRIYGNGSVTMTGGTICNATGGVYIDNNGCFTMTGGTITDNGSGVNIESADATFTVSGNVNITRNNDGNDVRLCYENDSFNPIHIGSDGLAATARIGVKRGVSWGAGEVKPFTSGLPGKGTKSNFVCNDANDPYYIVTVPNGELALIHPLELPKDNEENYLITGGIYFYKENNQRKAIIDASSTSTLCIPQDNNEWFDEDGVEVWGVAYDRTFNPGRASTVMLPFRYETQGDNEEGVYAEGGAFYRFIGVYQEDGKWVAMMDCQEYDLQANTPYLFVPDEGSTTMSFPGIDYSNSVRLTTEGGGGQQSTADGWVFQGTYAALSWTAGSTGDKTKIVGSEEDEAVYYGFAATSGKATDGETDVEVGQFVQVASGASIKPTRAYLKFTGGANARGAAAAEELPKTISVRLVKKGETMGIPTPDPSRAGGKDGYYTLSGQRLTNGQKPTAKGLYIINGRKEVVK